MTATQEMVIQHKRELRARQFTSFIMHMIDDCLAYRLRDEVYERLMRASIDQNLQVIQLPIELDVAEYISLKMAELTAVAPIIVEASK